MHSPKHLEPKSLDRPDSRPVGSDHREHTSRQLGCLDAHLIEKPCISTATVFRCHNQAIQGSDWSGKRDSLRLTLILIREIVTCLMNR